MENWKDIIKKKDSNFILDYEKAEIIEDVSSFDGAILKIKIPKENILALKDKGSENFNQIAISFVYGARNGKERVFLVKDFSNEQILEEKECDIQYSILFGIEIDDPCACLIKYKE